MSDDHAAVVVHATAAAAVPADMHPLVEAATSGGAVDPTNLAALMALQERWEATQARKAFAAALTRLKADLPKSIVRDAHVKFGATEYRHATLTSVMRQVTGPMTDHGFSVTWVPSTTRDGISVTCRLLHVGGHVQECTLTAPPDRSGSKNAVQSIASTITYLQRYATLSMLGIATHQPEPVAEASVSDRDQALTKRALAYLRKRGISVERAEDVVGRRVPEWTVGDVDKIRDWVRGMASASSIPSALEDVTDAEGLRSWLAANAVAVIQAGEERIAEVVAVASNLGVDEDTVGGWMVP